MPTELGENLEKGQNEMGAKSSEITCPSCGSNQLSPFYEVRDVPVHSSLMMPSREEALRFPRADIVLGFCRHCGFITNIAYDPAFQNYSSIYEDRQTFSPTFNSFARNLAQTLIRKYNLYEKDILEIGCGKGDFLALLCELGNNRGVGIDPTCVNERIISDASDRIKLIPEYYSEKHNEHTGDFVLCRHTLEHIHPAAEFLSTVRRAIGSRLDTGIFFEIPDALRVLREQAFWDIYYEHCSYFSPGSLARLFRHCGFELLDMSLDYGDQYLLIEAKPSDGPSSRTDDLEEEVEELYEEVQLFAEKAPAKIDGWRVRLKEYDAYGRRIAIWGSGSKCVAFLTTLGIDDEIEQIVDINPHRHNKFIPGGTKQIMPPEALRSCKPEVIIVMNPIYEDEIRQMLADMDLNPEVVSV